MFMELQTDQPGPAKKSFQADCGFKARKTGTAWRKNPGRRTRGRVLNNRDKGYKEDKENVLRKVWRQAGRRRQKV